MPRYDDRYGNTRLYVGRLSSCTRSRDLERLFSRYGRVRDVDMKYDYAFVEFSDPRDADDARYGLNGRDFDGSRLIVEIAKGTPRGAGGSREYLGSSRGGPPPGSGRCFNCGLDGHWARDCKAGDWKNKCYRCGARGHIERNCQNSPKKLRRGRSYSRSPVRSRSPQRGRSYSRSRSRSYSRSRSPIKRERHVEREERSRSPLDDRSPEPRESSSPYEDAKKSGSSPMAADGGGSPLERENGPREREEDSPSPKRSTRVEEEKEEGDGSGSPDMEERRYESSPDAATNGRSRSASPRDGIYDDGDGDNNDRRESPIVSE